MKTRLEMKTVIKISREKSSAFLLFRPPKSCSQTDNTDSELKGMYHITLPSNSGQEKQTFLNMAGFGRGGPKKGTSSRAVTET